MNTKQLWTALTLNPKTNFYFDGIFSIDTLKEIKEKPDLIICNTDPSDQPGEHTVLFFFNENSVDFYDSLGRDITYYGSEFINFIKNYTSHFEQCLRRMQPLESDLCGLDEPFCQSYSLGSLRKEPSRCVIIFVSFRVVPHGTQGTGPEIVTRSA